ncbi:uncharacterized protein LOC108915667 [Anoplophora glabripennis]|uniref:uncharacterized protein LOC108915667 n=1 Tax=Anoplophora glabripennis TaxID=217634 RepID=UPI00087482E4|nr:uncharacterized protein LOC108915667 [Anoplophora glabripennis]
MGYTSIKTRGKQAIERHIRTAKRSKRLEQDNLDIVEVGPSKDFTVEASTELEYTKEGNRSVEVQTDMSVDDITKLLTDANFTTERIQLLQKELNILDISEEFFVNNDDKTFYFTGFPKTEMMMIIFKNISNFLLVKSVLSPFKQFLLTLMKLRINLPFKYLSYKFGIAPSTASDIFYKCVDVMYARYKGLVVWPDRETLRKNIPECFKENFGNRVTVIIDCFEIFCETPLGLLNAARYWSNYKHHHRIKVLIGITPQGTISFISEAWTGRSSDKYLTENCGFLNKILPGDIILADRGFLIQDSVETLGGHLEIPAFTKVDETLSETSPCQIGQNTIPSTIVTGCMRITPTNVLSAECAEMALEYRRKWLAKLDSYCQSKRGYRTRRKVPYIIEVLKEVDQHAYNKHAGKILPFFEIEHTYQITPIEVADINNDRAQINSNKEFLSIFGPRFGQHTWIFTDGSLDKNQGNVGLGVFIPSINYKFSPRLPQLTQICTAEVIAINKAITICLERYLDKSFRLVQYADDIVIMTKGTSASGTNLTKEMNLVLENVNELLGRHDLTLFITKSSAIMFRKKNPGTLTPQYPSTTI